MRIAAWIALLTAMSTFAQSSPGEPDPLQQRLLRYAELSAKHRLSGLASYYSTSYDGRKTANGEIYRNGEHSAAHLTLPLGTWVEVTSRATGRTLRLRVNDRGPYARKFMLDLSQAAARDLGVDKHPDRYVEVRIIALPGDSVDSGQLSVVSSAPPERTPADLAAQRGQPTTDH